MTGKGYIMTDAVKSVGEEIKQAFDDFKKTNAQLLEAKASGKAVGEIEAKMAKINETMDKLDVAQKQLESAVKRIGMTGTEQKANASLAEKKAFRHFMRKGIEGDPAAGVTIVGSEELKALSVNDDTAGGYLVQADVTGRIVKRIFETSPIRQYANVQTINTDALEGLLDTDEASYGWVGETGVRSQTNTPKLGKWRIPTFEVYAMPAATQKLLDDISFDIEGWLSDKIADKIARAENAAFVNGDGVSSPRGFLTIPTVAENASLNYSSLKEIGYIKTGVTGAFPAVPTLSAPTAMANPLFDLIFSLKSQYREMPGTAFAMHRTTFGACRKLQDAMGNYLWQPGLAGQPSTLMGYPVAEFNDMPQIATGTASYSIAFANWKEAYQIVDRQGVKILRDPFTAKPYILFYSVKRTGGDVINCEAIKLLNFSA
jgi:HK97 family phage major capsid protein